MSEPQASDNQAIARVGIKERLIDRSEENLGEPGHRHHFLCILRNGGVESANEEAQEVHRILLTPR